MIRVDLVEDRPIHNPQTSALILQKHFTVGGVEELLVKEDNLALEGIFSSQETW